MDLKCQKGPTFTVYEEQRRWELTGPRGAMQEDCRRAIRRLSIAEPARGMGSAEAANHRSS
jgi:hypothetical protein